MFKSRNNLLTGARALRISLCVLLLLAFSRTAPADIKGEVGPMAQYAGSGRLRHMIAISNLLVSRSGCQTGTEHFSGRITMVLASDNIGVPMGFSLAMNDGRILRVNFDSQLSSRLSPADRPYFLEFISRGRRVNVSARRCIQGMYVAESIAEMSSGAVGRRVEPSRELTPVPPKPPEVNPATPERTNTRMKDATIQSFKQYRRDRERANNSKLSSSEYFEMRVKLLSGLDTKGIDPDLKRYFELLARELVNTLGIVKQAEREARASDWIDSVAEALSPEPENDFVALGMMWAKARMDNASFVGWKTRWMPLYAAAGEENEAESERLLASLSWRYGYPFYSSVYVFEQLASREGRTTTQLTTCRGFRSTTRFKISQSTVTNFVVCAGDRVSITTAGFMQVGQFTGFTGPDGLDTPFLQLFNVIPGFPHAALLVKFQSQSDRAWTNVGYDLDLLAPVSAPLKFIVNDAKTDDNSREFIVQVTVRPPP